MKNKKINFLQGVEYELKFIYTGKDYNLNLRNFLVQPNCGSLRIHAQTYIDFVFGHEDFDEGFVVIKGKL